MQVLCRSPFPCLSCLLLHLSDNAMSNREETNASRYVGRYCSFACPFALACMRRDTCAHTQREGKGVLGGVDLRG